jgi:hypothetical protein
MLHSATVPRIRILGANVVVDVIVVVACVRVVDTARRSATIAVASSRALLSPPPCRCTCRSSNRRIAASSRSPRASPHVMRSFVTMPATVATVELWFGSMCVLLFTDKTAASSIRSCLCPDVDFDDDADDDSDAESDVDADDESASSGTMFVTSVTSRPVDECVWMVDYEGWLDIRRGDSGA